jgi:glutathione S-transferase
MRIPAEPDRDADLVLSTAADMLERQHAELERLRAEKAELKSRLAAAEKDAARYRWLRGRDLSLADAGVFIGQTTKDEGGFLLSMDDADAAIDKAMGEGS